MKVKAVRLYGKKDLRFEEFELRDIGPDEILARVVTDSLCMSSYKAMLQGSDHRCIPQSIAEFPIIMGHELCGVVERVGEEVKDRFQAGESFAVQAKMYFDGVITSPGYSYTEYGGNATHIIVPAQVLRDGYVLKYKGGACYKASMAEPISCIVSALVSQYHLADNHKDHIMGLKQGGCMAILAGCGPMGLGAAEVAMAMESKPRKIVITDIDARRMQRAKEVLKPKNGVELVFVNAAAPDGAVEALLELTEASKGFDDVVVMAPVPGVIETADHITGLDSCINFFAGPTKKDFYAAVNFYDVHYNYKHIIGSSGGDLDDMKEALRLIETGAVNPALLISHVGGLNAAAAATLNLPNIPGTKKLIYCGIDMELTAIDDFAEKGRQDPLFAALNEICARHSMLWSKEAEDYLLAHGKKILPE